MFTMRVGSRTAVLAIAVIALAALSGGCAASGTGAGSRPSPQDECEGPRGGGVWVSAAGVCLRSGGS